MIPGSPSVQMSWPCPQTKTTTIHLRPDALSHLRRVRRRFGGAELGYRVIGFLRELHALRLFKSGRSFPCYERGELVDEIVHIVERSALMLAQLSWS